MKIFASAVIAAFGFAAMLGAAVPGTAAADNRISRKHCAPEGL
jgi:hypothetical protein